MQLGCGNSKLSEDLYDSGWKHIVNVDFSSVVIEMMKKRTIEMPSMKWIVADIFHLDQIFSKESFDYAIDKGTLDAILTQKHDPWDPEPEIISQIQSYINQVAATLKTGAKFIHITFSQPHFRKRFLELSQAFDIHIHSLSTESDSFEYFIYECIKI